MLMHVLSPLQHSAAALFASVLILVAVFLIARVAHVRQTVALALALAPMAIGLLLEHAMVAALFA
jgi:hypothetical protein